MTKIRNRVGFFLSYASQRGYTLVNRRLYLPQEWVENKEYKERRAKCGVPEDIAFKTQPTLALEMVQELREDDSLPNLR